MRRLWAAVVLIAITLGICFFNRYYLNKVYEETGRYVKKISSLYKKEKYSDAVFTANELENSWKNNEKVLEKLISEDKLESVRVIISELPNLAKNESHEFSIHLKKLTETLKHILEKEEPRLY